MFNKITGKSEPKRSYLLGQSMGGFQTQLAMHAYPTMFDGALAMCGMNSANWDLYVALGAAAEYVFSGRLVADEERRVVDDGARDRDALLLAAGQLVGQRRAVVRETDEPEHLRHLAPDRVAALALHLERVGDVLVGGAVRGAA